VENTSGQGKNAAVPPEIERWNWGAFLLNWIWGIGNQTYIALLCFIPFVNLVMPFVLGANGSRWAWQNRRWDSVEHFRRVQREWTKWGLIILGGSVAVFIIIMSAGMMLVFSILKDTEAYRTGVAAVTASPAAAAELGVPLTPGMAMGSLNCQGHNCEADINFSVSGPKGKGVVSVHGLQRAGQWRFDRIELDVEGSGKHIDLRPPS
jgi:hypothetical protein